MNGWHHDHCLRCQKPSPRLSGSADEGAAHCCWCWDCWGVVTAEIRSRVATPPGCRSPEPRAVVPARERHGRPGKRAHLVACREAEELYVKG